MATNFGRGLEIFDMLLDSAQLFSILPRLYKKFVKGDEPEKKQRRLEQLLEDGQVEVASEEVINSWTTGLSGADEMRLLGDVCFLIATAEKNILPEEGYAFFSFLDKSGEKVRTRFREAYITEKTRDNRLDVIYVLAKLPNDEQRTAFLVGDGLLDPTLAEELFGALSAPIKGLARIAKADLPELEKKHAERVAKRKPKEVRKHAGTFLGAIGSMFKLRLF